MGCIKCNGENILSIGGKTGDLCSGELQGIDFEGGVPEGFNLGGGDYLQFKLCIDCGQVQGEFPITDDAVNEAKMTAGFPSVFQAYTVDL